MKADALQQLARRLGALSGWRRAGAALLLGIAGFLAMPPINLMPMLVISLTGLVWLLDGAGRPRGAFFDAWLWGMGFFVPCLYWIAASMFVDLAQFWWMIPCSLLGLPAAMSLYLAAAMALDHAVSARTGSLRLVAFAGWWTLAEWARGHLFTGFPWLLAGYVWSGDSPVLLAALQSASIVGIYGLSFVTVLLCVSPACLADDLPMKRRLIPPALGFVVFAGGAAWGAIRLTTPDSFVPDARIRIVSTDVPHHAAPDAASNIADFNRVLGIARRADASGVSASVWPEGVVPYPLNLDGAARAAVAGTVPAGAIVLTGTIRVVGQEPTVEAWNNLAAIDHNGGIIGSYDKHHLVPFGEYVPLHSIFNFTQIAAQRFDFSTGPGPKTLDLPQLPPVAPIICYEAIFPDDVVDETHRPSWMVNITDDGWFGDTIGPAQHFAIARVRAVEEGLPLVRAANGGVSALIDPYGRRLASSPVSLPTTLDVTLPKSIPQNKFYVYFHNWLLLFLVILSILLGISRRHLNRS